MKSHLLNTLTLSTENLIQIGLEVSEIWPTTVKTQWARLFRQAHLFGKIWCTWSTIYQMTDFRSGARLGFCMAYDQCYIPISEPVLTNDHTALYHTCYCLYSTYCMPIHSLTASGICTIVSNFKLNVQLSLVILAVALRNLVLTSVKVASLMPTW